MATTKVHSLFVLSACFCVAMATRAEDSLNLKDSDYYSETDDDVVNPSDAYDYYDDILYRDKLINSLMRRADPESNLLPNRESIEDDIATQLALGDNYDAYNSLTNKREDERIDDFNTQQDNAGEIPKKFNEPIVLDKSAKSRGADVNSPDEVIGDNNNNNGDSVSQTSVNENSLLRNHHNVNYNDSNSRFAPFEKRQMMQMLGRNVETCSIDTIYINIQYEENIQTQDGTVLLLTCTDGVIVNKCEGTCRSSVKPTLTSPDGYVRSCSCCKDASVRSRTVTLSMCTLGSEEVHGYEITRTLLEPTSCSCQSCRN